MEVEQRGEQSISLSMSRIAEMATSAVTNREKGGQIKRDGKERTHGHSHIWTSLKDRLLWIVNTFSDKFF